ncbi:lipid kinase, YegS/Rv2252/BmrU family [Gracilibacillus ureilyticus]|uniref:Lipid kinase, YegS/Rv2252/BmrU family n=1 Tax=Gracilibacillus ureilyticus TaxID=531814 RepID=A0A1H9RCW6_9BACI|nr:diacylglycerol kinase family protein [Gracilibacillus ureilyticus]SER70524.1 lipid kinase, YegS/Rv2252/BmrU family [Gracilibacillus ureilyticus]
MKKALIIINPSSGTEESMKYKEMAEDLLTKNDYQFEVLLTEKENDAKRYAEDACAEEIDLLVVMGGDGTINEVINALVTRENRPVLHVVPLGTVNNFARAVDIPLRPQAALQLIENGVMKNVDVGKVNQQYFVNLVNVGAIAEATYHVTTEQKSKLGSLAYLLEGLKKFREKDVFRVAIETGGDKVELEAMLVLVAVTDTFASWKNLIKEAEIDDGYFHVFVIKQLTNFEGVAMLTKLMSGSLKEQEQVEYFKVKELTITTEETKIANVDGDEGTATPLHLSILPKHLRVLTQN